MVFLVGAVYILIKYVERRYPSVPTRKDFVTFIGPRVILLAAVVASQLLFEVPVDGGQLITQILAIIGLISSIELAFKMMACHLMTAPWRYKND